MLKFSSFSHSQTFDQNIFHRTSITKLHNGGDIFVEKKSCHIQDISRPRIFFTSEISMKTWFFNKCFVIFYCRCLRKLFWLVSGLHGLIAVISVSWYPLCKKRPIQFNNCSWTNSAITNQNQSMQLLHTIYIYPIIFSDID